MEDWKGAFEAETLKEFFRCRFHEPLSLHTAWRVGGYARAFVEIEDMIQLKKVVEFCKKNNIPLIVIGGGNKMLFKEDYPGVVIKLVEKFKKIKVSGTQIIAGAGARIEDVCNVAYIHSLGGMEFGIDIPGTIGGALRMNAGAFGRCFADILKWLLLFDGKIKKLYKEEIPFSYRESGLREGIITYACLQLHREKKHNIMKKQLEYKQRRRSSQPIGMRTTGCVFKNPKEINVGELVKKLGLCGYRIGGAYISEKHGNFIITEDGASINDVLSLIEKIKGDALKVYGIKLEEEVKII